MPQPIQTAGISDRLRRFFRLRGRTGFQLDETVVPVVNVQDLDNPLYRLQEQGWHATAASAPGVAPGIPLVNTIFLGRNVAGLPVEQDVDSPGKANIKGMLFSTAGLPTLPMLIEISLVGATTAIANATTVIQINNAMNTDNPAPDPDLPITGNFLASPLVCMVSHPAGAFLGPTQRIMQIQLGFDAALPLFANPVWVPMDVVLRGHVALMVRPGNLDQTFAVSWFGTYDPTIER